MCRAQGDWLRGYYESECVGERWVGGHLGGPLQGLDHDACLSSSSSLFWVSSLYCASFPGTRPLSKLEKDQCTVNVPFSSFPLGMGSRDLG